MQPDRYIIKSRIIDLTSRDLPGALRELLAVTLTREKKLNPEAVLKLVLEQETIMATCLGNGVAMPHARLPMSRPYLMAVGRTSTGLEYNGVKDYNNVRFVFLLLAADEQPNYLNMLASLARQFGEKELIEHMVRAPTLLEFQERVLQGFRRQSVRPERKLRQFNRRMLTEAEKLANAAKCAAMLLFTDTFTSGLDAVEVLPKIRTIVVSRSPAKRYQEGKSPPTTIEVRSLSKQRLSQMRSAILIGLSSGIFKLTDKICCVGGIAASNLLDCLVVVDISKEFQGAITREHNLLPPGVKIEVFERVLGIATDLSIEGREGKPVGALFVVGDTDKVNQMIKPLVLNPFYGYKEEDRNILNPFMDETLKEFSVIDGCFIIRGNGVVESAGSLIHAPSEYYKDMPSGLGSRHAAAAAISLATDCTSIAVSASTGQVSLFRRGAMVSLMETPLAERRISRT
ncbi:MAG: diadenylate cyclase [Verrucomicrobiota bacterium]|nr:diadenylate cyclase [Verrucomicrobiota bacterium]